MSTNANVLVKTDEGFKSIYIHWDGYPEGVGNILKEHYNTQEKAEQVVSLGDLSSLDKSMECPEGHTFNAPVDGYSIAYGRDRGEENVETKMFRSLKDFFWDGTKYWKYIYCWNGKQWKTGHRRTKKSALIEEFSKV